MSFKILIGLIGSNLIWSAHPLMGKLVLAEMSPAAAAWCRYASALLAYLIAVAVMRMKNPFFVPQGKKEWTWAVILGFMPFCFSPLFQMTGLAASRATDNSLIIAMEPLVAVLMAAVFLRERVGVQEVLAFATALVGFFFLSDMKLSTLGGGWDSHAFGNIIMLLSLFGECSYSVVGKKLVRRYRPQAVFGTALGLGVLFLTLGTAWVMSTPGYPDFLRLTWKGAIAVLWMGPLGTTLTYLFWMHALVDASVVSISLVIFIQPVFGALLGVFFLGESLGKTQFLGGGLILLALLIQTVLNARRNRV